MDRADHGGMAFPSPATPTEYTEFGMTLLDWFAGEALKGLLASPEPPEVPEGEGVHDFIAEACYGYGESMLEARKRRGLK